MLQNSFPFRGHFTFPIQTINKKLSLVNEIMYMSLSAKKASVVLTLFINIMIKKQSTENKMFIIKSLTLIKP